ncbi:hypothetical protein K505DRAFT_260981, partial [Melanomma pulvis-pyrius CBS 109.77]
NIVVVCMPPHSLRLLQPLDVGCFSPLKWAYRDNTHQIKKGCFPPTLYMGFNMTFTTERTSRECAQRGTADVEAILATTLVHKVEIVHVEDSASLNIIILIYITQ